MNPTRGICARAARHSTSRPSMNDDVRLRGAYPALDRRIKIGRPRHAIPRGKHRLIPVVSSRSERPPPLATPARHDRPPGPGTHPQPEAVYPGSTPVVRLKGPLALGHGYLLYTSAAAVRLDSPVGPGGPCRILVSRGELGVSLVAGAVSPDPARALPYRQRSGDCTRVLSVLSPGQTRSRCGRRNIAA